MEKSPYIFIIGAPRSGTSLLMRMLMVNQPRVLGVDAESQVYALESVVDYSWQKVMGLDYFNALIQDASVLEELARRASSFTELLKLTADHCLGKKSVEDSVFIEKSPIHTLYTDKIENDFGSPRFLLVTREPGAVIHSMVQARWIPIFGKRLKEIPILKFIPYLIATVIYYDYFDAMEKFKANGLAYEEVKYEHLVKLSEENARVYLSELIGFQLQPLYIERPFSPEATNRSRVLHQDRVDAFKQKVPRIILWLQHSLTKKPAVWVDCQIRKIFMNLVRLRRARSKRPLTY